MIDKKTTKLGKNALYFIVIFLGLFMIFSTDVNPKKTNETYRINAIKLPAEMDFCSENVPLDQQDIKERIDRELLVNTYWQSNGLLLIKRCNKYLPIIEDILAKNKIPQDFKYLAVIESGLTNVVSPAGASGFWQILKKTAIENNLEVNKNVDERYHLEKATQAACDYLNHAYDVFGSWTLAAASYNMGINGVKRRLEQQAVSSYYDLLLNEETSRYLPRIIAVKEILSHPKSYGFIFDREDVYPFPTHRVIKVDTTISDLSAFAKANGINYKKLKLLNPWLRSNELPNSMNKEYKIKVMVN